MILPTGLLLGTLVAFGLPSEADVADIKERVALLEETVRRQSGIDAKIEELLHFRTIAKVLGSVLGLFGVSLAVVTYFVFQKVDAALTKAESALAAAETASTKAVAAQKSADTADARKNVILSELEAKGKASAAELDQALESARQRLDSDISVTAPAIASRIDSAIEVGKSKVVESSKTILPIGTILTFAGPLSAAPAGDWLPCDGRPMSSTAEPGDKPEQYKPLFSTISTYWGDGSRNADGTRAAESGHFDFNLPDMRGQFLRGCNDARVDRRLFPGESHAIDAGPRIPYGKGPTTEVGTIEEWSTGNPGGRANASTVYAPQKAGEVYVSITNLPGPNAVSRLSFDPETRPINVSVRYYIRVR